MKAESSAMGSTARIGLHAAQFTCFGPIHVGAFFEPELETSERTKLSLLFPVQSRSMRKAVAPPEFQFRPVGLLQRPHALLPSELVHVAMGLGPILRPGDLHETGERSRSLGQMFDREFECQRLP